MGQITTTSKPAKSAAKVRSDWAMYLKGNWDLYLMLAPAVILIAIFAYWPMYGVVMAFQNFNPISGITGSPWVGLMHFERFFATPTAMRIITNTVVLSVQTLIFTFPAPILLALMLHYCVSRRFARVVQTATYFPFFIATVVLVGMMHIFFSPSVGMVNHAIEALGGQRQVFMADSVWFRPLYVGSRVWQGTGFGAIIFIAALAGVDPGLYEAATIDGASKWKRILHIDLPCIMPTIVIMLILSLGSIMSVGFEQVFLMQNARNTAVSEIIATYVYSMGLLEGRFSFAAAVGLFNSVVNFALLIIVNQISRKVSETSLW
ncbi:MAG: ABC transporter permease subunit [Defluviitaleaceae bacterium]|nr:ABC transporter permease subunit [Defluviitaleaceae bacterium]